MGMRAITASGLIRNATAAQIDVDKDRLPSIYRSYVNKRLVIKREVSIPPLATFKRNGWRRKTSDVSAAIPLSLKSEFVRRKINQIFNVSAKIEIKNDALGRNSGWEIKAISDRSKVKRGVVVPRTFSP